MTSQQRLHLNNINYWTDQLVDHVATNGRDSSNRKQQAIKAMIQFEADNLKALSTETT